MKRLAVLIILAVLLPAPAFAWYYFTARNGLRTQWIFGSSCNSGSRPIVMFYDSDLPAAYFTAGGLAIDDWNTAAGGWLKSALPERNMHAGQSKCNDVGECCCLCAAPRPTPSGLCMIRTAPFFLRTESIPQAAYSAWAQD